MGPISLTAGGGEVAAPGGPNPRLMFASYHAYLDPASGAALSTRDLFEALRGRGWDCRAVCGPQTDGPRDPPPGEVLRGHGLAHHVQRCAPPGAPRYDLYHFTLNGVPVTQYRPDGFSPGRPATQAEGGPFLDLVGRACVAFRPDVVLTYGGPPVGGHLIRRAKRRGARVVFALHNLAYRDRGFFTDVDALMVPSEFARRRYLEEAGLEAEAAPWPWGRERATADCSAGRHVTFVNPQPAKGVAWFARIAAEVHRRRPEIPFLAVEGRGDARWLDRLAPAVGGLGHVRRVRTTPAPREFYSQSRMVLMPSLCEETFGRVAAEALSNGIPVLASRRGALPETLGGAGLLFDIPEGYAARPLDVPPRGEAAGWAEAVERLWDGGQFYDACRARCLERAAEWDTPRLMPRIEEFFRRVARGGSTR